MKHCFRDIFLFPFLFVLLLCSSTSLKATDCLANGIWTWPQDSLVVNGRIIITGYAMDQEMIRDFSFQHPRLVSSSEEIPLLVEAVYESQHNLTQAVLIPSQPLQSGMKYWLEVDSMRWLYGITPDFFYPNDSSEFRWTVTDQFDVTPPKWQQGPAALGAYADVWGGMEILLEYVIEDIQKCAIEVELAPTEGSGEIQKFIVMPLQDTGQTQHIIDIGYHVCLGEFMIEQGIGYRARFTAIDASGNRTEYPHSCVLRYGEQRSSMTADLKTPFVFSQEGCREERIRQEGEEAEEKIRVD